MTALCEHHVFKESTCLTERQSVERIENKRIIEW